MALTDLLGVRVGAAHAADRGVRTDQVPQRRGVQLQGRDQLVVPFAVQRAGLGRVVDQLAQVVRVVAARQLVDRLARRPGAGSTFASAVQRDEQRAG